MRLSGRTPSKDGALALGLVIGLALAGTSAGRATEIDAERSLVAVVTHKEGVAAGLAHEHLVSCRKARQELRFDPRLPLEASFSLELNVEDLEVDRSEVDSRWRDWLLERGLLFEPKKPVDEKDRAKIRRAMLGEGQLDAEHFPTLRVRTLGIREATPTLSSLPKLEGFEVTVDYEIEIRDRTLRREAAARWSLEDGRFRIEVVGELLFGDLGIEPYSTLLGAIRNADLLHLVLILEGPVGEEGS